MQGAAVVALDEQHEGGGPVLGGIGIAGVNLHDAGVAGAGGNHEVSGVLDLVGSVVRVETLFGAGFGGVAGGEGGVVVQHPQVIDPVGNRITVALGQVVRRLDMELHRRFRPSCQVRFSSGKGGGGGEGEKGPWQHHDAEFSSHAAEFAPERSE